MPSSTLSSIYSCCIALNGITKDKVQSQMPSIFTLKYVNDFIASEGCTDLVNVFKHIKSSNPIIQNQMVSSSDITGGASGRQHRSTSNNLQLLLKVRSLFTIALSISILGWFEPDKYTPNAAGWVLEYYKDADDQVEGDKASGWWVHGPVEDVCFFITLGKARDAATAALRRARLSSSIGVAPKFTPTSSFPSYFAPILLKHLYSEIGSEATAALRRELPVGAAPLAARLLDEIVAAPNAHLSPHIQAMLAIERVDMKSFFSTTYNSAHPVFNFGQFQSGLDFEEFKTMDEALVDDSPLDKEGQAWGSWYFKLISTPATNADPRYNAMLENAAGYGKLQNEVASLSRYINIGSRLISFLLLKNLLQLPQFSTVDDPLHFFSKVNTAVLLITVDDRLIPHAQTFLRLQLIRYDGKAATFVPVHLAKVSQDLAGLSSTLKSAWRSNYTAMVHSNVVLIEPRDRTIDGISQEFSRKIYDGRISESAFVGSIFTLLAQCAKYRDAEAAVKFVPDEEAAKVGKVAGMVDDVYISGDHVVALHDVMIDQSKVQSKALWSSLHHSINDALDGKIKIISNDNDSAVSTAASFSYSLKPVAEEAISETVHSSDLIKLWKEALIALTRTEFMKELEKDIALGHLQQAAFGLEAANRSTELSNICRASYDGGGIRDLKHLPAYRSACDTVSQLLVRRTKTKFIGNGKMVYMVSSMTPTLTLLTIFYSGMREALLEAWEFHVKDETVPEEARTFLYLNKTGFRQNRTDGSTNFKAQVAQAHDRVKEDAGALFDPRNMPFGIRQLRHFQAHVLKVVLDEQSQINGGSAANRRADAANKTLLGHSSSTNSMYRDDGGCHTKTISVNSSELLNFNETSKRCLKMIGFSDTVNGRSASDKHYEHDRYLTLEAAIGVVKTDSLDVRLKKFKDYLQTKGLCFLARAIGKRVLDDIQWRDEIADAVAECLVHGCTFDGEARNLKHIKLYAPQSRGKTVVPLVLALLNKHLLSADAVKPPCMVIVYANTYLQSKL
jgi:hypothetical protein